MPRGEGSFSLELRQGEVDKANTKHMIAVEEALLSLENCEVFKDMVQCEPREISDVACDSGFQAVFDQEMYAKAIATGTYTTGGNLFWVDFRWSATPGVPLRLEAVKDLANAVSKSRRHTRALCTSQSVPGLCPSTTRDLGCR